MALELHLSMNVGFVSYIAVAVLLALIAAKLAMLVKSKKRFMGRPMGQHISPLVGFKIKQQEPLADCPFKATKTPKMGLKKIDWNNWLLVDKHLASTLKDKRESIAKYPGQLVKANSIATEAVHELYDSVLEFLCTRYPSCYEMASNSVINKVMGETMPYPAASSKMDSEGLLKLMAFNIEEDFLLLEYDDEELEYRLRAGNFVYPAGFNPVELVDLKLSEIHGPVPLYQDHLSTPMNRFFKNIRVGQVVERRNWACQLGTTLCKPNVAETFKSKQQHVQDQSVNVDIGNLYVRSERQTLTRLPHTKWLVFTARTYLWPLTTVKEKGLLAESIEQLHSDFAMYKGRPIWGEKVLEFCEAANHIEV